MTNRTAPGAFGKQLKETEFSNHACAFLDLLGQSEELREFDRQYIHRPLQDDDEFRKLVNRSCGRVVRFLEDIDEAIVDFRSSVGSKVPEKHREYWLRMTDYEFKCYPLSDGILIAVPLKIDREVLPIHGLGLLLAICANIMLKQLARGTAIRGGVSIGLLAEIWEKVFYGPGLATAYKIESRAAKYPRIVVGWRVLEYIQSCIDAPAEAVKELLPKVSDPELYVALSKAAAEVCQRFLMTDDDGSVIVHYLDSYHLGGIEPAEAYRYVGEARRFVYSELARFQAWGDTELYERYRRLRNYFDHCLPQLEQDWASRQASPQVDPKTPDDDRGEQGNDAAAKP